MATFCKNEDCPTSQELLAFELGDIPVADSRPIRAHLAVCEFCAAEIEFYEHYPPREDFTEAIEYPAMPAPLQELAEALIGKKNGSREMDELFRGMDVEDWGR
ncbi:hypothetical protein BH24ACI3_BH24ACI3_04450 [soil metagenome]